MSQQLLAMAAELEDRHKHLEDTAANLSQRPKQNTTGRRHTSVYWCDSRESCRTKCRRDFGLACHCAYWRKWAVYRKISCDF